MIITPRKPQKSIYNSLIMQRIFNQLKKIYQSQMQQQFSENTIQSYYSNPTFPQQFDFNFSDNSCVTKIHNIRWTHKFAAIDIMLIPRKGQFTNMKFNIVVYLGDKYPHQSAIIFSRNIIYHPNINLITKQIELEINKDWKSIFDLRLIIKSLKLMVIEPFMSCIPDNIQNMTAAIQYQNRESDNLNNFRKKVKMVDQNMIDIQSNIFEEDFQKKNICDISRRRQYIHFNKQVELEASLLNQKFKSFSLKQN